MGAMKPAKLEALKGVKPVKPLGMKGVKPMAKGGVTKSRKDGDKFTEYAKGGKTKGCKK